jgi:hypothetical protein
LFSNPRPARRAAFIAVCVNAMSVLVVPLEVMTWYGLNV